MKGPYVNEDGDLWIERGDVPWSQAQAAARAYLDEMGNDEVTLRGRRLQPMRFVGIENDVRVSDEHEYPHDVDDEGCDGCCRTIEAWHFRAEEA